MENDGDFCEPNCIATMNLLLRRTLVRSVIIINIVERS